MNELMIFEGNNVEVFNYDGKVLFNQKEVGKWKDMSYSTVKDHVRNFNNNQVIKLTNKDILKDGLTNFRKIHNTGENFLTESGVYKLAFKSRKAEAERFTDWIADEVLPSIRKTGNYVSNSTPMISNKDLEVKCKKGVNIDNLYRVNNHRLTRRKCWGYKRKEGEE